MIIIAILVVLSVIYFYISGGSAPSNSSLVESGATPQASVASGRILNLLNQIKSLNIDVSIFKDEAYRTLVDYSVAIPSVNVGRPNPFAPIPGVSNEAAR